MIPLVFIVGLVLGFFAGMYTVTYLAIKGPDEEE